MWWGLALPLLYLLVCNAVAQRVVGGREPLVKDEFDSEQFVGILDEANAECNRQSNDSYWHKVEAVLDATKQVVEGINYDFRIRQRPTNCTNSAMLEKVANDSDSACDLRTPETVRICSVSVWHRPWLSKTEVTLKNLWSVRHYDKSFGEIYTKLRRDHPKWNKMKDMVDVAVLHYNLNSTAPHLYKISEADFTLKKNKQDGSTWLSLHLDETKCDKISSVDELAEAQKNACFSQKTGLFLECLLQVTGSGVNQPRLVKCHGSAMLERGMWRAQYSGGNGVTTVQQNCYVPKETANGHRVPPSTLHNIARLDVRALTADEIHSRAFKEAVKTAVLEYNARTNALYMYSVHHTQHEKLQLAPKTAYEFSMTLKPTSCIKNQVYLENSAKFEEDCQTVSSDMPFVKCHFTIPTMGTDQDKRQLVTFKDCETAGGRPGILVGAPLYIPEEKRTEASFQAMLSRVAKEYSAQNNSRYEYKIIKAENVKQQTVAGMLYTMNVEMKAVELKGLKKEDKKSKLNETIVHCQVRIFQQTWNNIESVNFTNCWHSVRLLKEIEGKWELYSPKDYKKLDFKLQISERVPMLGDLSTVNGDLVLDYLTNVYKLKVKDRKIYTFDINLRGTNNSDRSLKCKALAVKQHGGIPEPNMFAYDCKPKHSVSGPRLFGAPTVLDEEKVQSVEFQKTLEQAAETYNLQSNDLYYYRFLALENATRQLVSGVKTIIFLYLQRTNCQKNTQTEYHRLKQHSLCGQMNNTHAMLCEMHVLEPPNGARERTEIKACHFVGLDEVPPVLSLEHEFQHTSTYREMVERARMVYNLYTDRPVFYRVHRIENLFKKNKEKTEYQFEMFLRPTDCAKWNETLLFLNKQYEFCTESYRQEMVKCTAEVSFKSKTNAVKKVELEDCEYIFVQPGDKSRPLTRKEISDHEFRELVNKSANLFNSQVRSPHWFEPVHVENPTLEHVSGRHYTYKLYMAPTKCHPDDPESEQGACKHIPGKFMVSCEVEAWTREWTKNHKTVDLSLCHLIPVESAPQNSVQQLTNNELCVRDYLPKLLNLFTTCQNVSELLADPVVENIEEQHLPGKRVTFDVYFKPLPHDGTCVESKQISSQCDVNHFYTCKASFWIRPSEDRTELDIWNCAKVEMLSSKPTESKLNDLLQKSQLKALQLYNDKLAKNYIFGSPEISDAKFETDFGTKLTFQLVMEPVACPLKEGAKTCELDQSKIRAKCFVVVRHQPWLSGTESLHLKNCFETFGTDWEDGHGELTPEEQNSDGFRQMIESLAQLYNPEVPIVYTVKKLQGTQVHNVGDWRNITTELVLQPVGCNDSLPNSQDKRCVDWSKQNEVTCEGTISEDKKTGGLKYLQLLNCRELWQPESKRPMSPTEQNAQWFKENLETAWKMQSDLPKGLNLYTITSINDPAIETSKDRIITYSLKLLETDCVKDRDEHRFANGMSPDCPIKDKPMEKTCLVTLTQQADGRHGTQIRCQAGT